MAVPSVAEKRANRDKVLAQLYEEVDGEPTLRDVHYEVLGPKVGLEDPELSSAVY